MVPRIQREKNECLKAVRQIWTKNVTCIIKRERERGKNRR